MKQTIVDGVIKVIINIQESSRMTSVYFCRLIPRIFNSGAILTCGLLLQVIHPEQSITDRYDFLMDYLGRIAGETSLGFNNAIYFQSCSVEVTMESQSLMVTMLLYNVTLSLVFFINVYI